MRILIFGPQGVGKGTQAALLAPYWGIPHISTGDLFRVNVENKTYLGNQVRAAVEAGNLVSDSITQHMLTDRLNQPDALQGFLLDGFPRTLEQAGWLDQMLSGTSGIDSVVLLRAPNEVLIERAMRRGRQDDTAEAVARRLAVYERNTSALLRFYGGLIESIDGNRPAQLVHQEIIARISDRATAY